MSTNGNTAGPTPGTGRPEGLNYYIDNGNNPGQSFTTGSNPDGYLLTSVSFKTAGIDSGGIGTGPQAYRLRINQYTNATAVGAPLLTYNSPATFSFTDGDWLQVSGMALLLQPNTKYTYAFRRNTGGWCALGVATNTGYAGGEIGLIPTGGGTVLVGATHLYDATFIVGLSTSVIAGLPTATPNPAYALSPVTLTATAAGPGTLGYQWQTDGGSGGSLTNIPGATGTNLVVIPPDTGSTYTINYDFVVTNNTSAATSSVVALTVDAASAPQISQDTTPTNVVSYVGGTATFTASFIGTQPITNQWQTDAGQTGTFTNIPSATNTTLALTSVQPANAGQYRLAASNLVGSSNSTPALLTIITGPPAPDAGQKYAYQIYTNGPFAYWRFSETNDPATSPYTVPAYDYSGNAHFPTYGTAVTVNIAGPTNTDFPGFENTNLAAGTTASLPNATLTVPPLNLNTNTVTFVAWIKPGGPQPASTGLLFARDGADNACGFGFNGQNNGAGTMAQLGYTWNLNASGTWGWNSGLYPLPDQWNFVAYVITPTNETTYLGYVDPNAQTTNFLSAVNTLAHTNQPFNGGTVLLGGDSQGTGRTFNGLIDEAALYNKSLSQSDVLKLFLTGLGSGPIPPSLGPLGSKSVYSGAHVQLTDIAGGSPTITYQWQSGEIGSGVFTNIPLSVNAGAHSPTLDIASAGTANALDYQVIAANSVGSGTSSVATLTVTVVPPGGLWTVNFQLTNNVLGFATSTSGLGRYTGRGVLGTGTYWNPIPDLAGAFTGGTYNSVSDFRENGVTHSGIYATVNGGGFSSAQNPATDTSAITTLLDQYVNVYNPLAANGGGLILRGVPDGTYNMVVYGIDASFHDRGAVYIVHAANGDQTQTIANVQDGYFSPGDNSLLFTNVEVAGGTLGTDITANRGEAEFNGVQLQLLSYASTINSITLTNTYDTTNRTLTLSWPQGILQTATNVAGPWSPIYQAPPFTLTVPATSAMQFYRLQIQ